MRIRQVKPAFWTDSVIAELSAPCRLFYIGLWGLADDAGYFRTDVPQIGVELYGYEARGKRERNVESFLASLGAAGRIERFDCEHGRIPTFKDHQRLAGETHQVVTIKREHEGCSRIPADTRASPLVPGTVRNGRGKVRDVEERNGTSRASDPAGPRAPSEFAARVPRPA